MVADLLVVEYSLVLFVHPVGLKDKLGMRGEFSRDYSKHLFAGGSVIFGESFGIGTRVSDCLVLFVERIERVGGFGLRANDEVGWLLSAGSSSHRGARGFGASVSSSP